MVPLPELWMPIGVATVLVFFASFMAWMVLPHHRSDWRRVNDEDGLMNELKRQKLGPGQYSFPHCANPGAMKDPAWQAKMKEGPSGMLIVNPPGGPAMGKSLTLYFIYCLLVSIVTAYVAGRTLQAGAHYLGVFRVAGTVAFLAYSGAVPVGAIWFGRSWSSAIKEILDGLVFALLTAGAFGWLWPR